MNMKAVNMICKGVVEACACLYGFSASEALEKMDIVVDGGSKKAKVKKVDIPLPLKEKNGDCCNGIRMNQGLYTQCPNKATDLCKSCSKEVEKHGSLPYGNVDERLAAGSEYKDSKGRKPIPYARVLSKLNISREMAEAYALEVGVVLNDSDFELPAVADKKVKIDDGKRGRPKKNEKTVEVNNSEDLFAGLVQSSLNESTVVEDEDEKAEKLALEKAEKKAALEAERAAKKATLEAEKLAKAEKLEAEKLAKAEKLEAEKLAKAEKLALEKAEKLAKAEKLEAEKLAKAEKLALEKAEKEAKKAALEAERAAKKAALEAKKSDKPKKTTADAKPVAGGAVAVAEVEDNDEDEVTVTKFEFGGKKYLKSSKNVLYDAETQDEIGVWNEAKQEIEFAELEEEEEEE